MLLRLSTAALPTCESSGGALEPIRKLLESYESDVIAFQALDTVFGGAPIDTTIAHVPGAAGLPLGKPRRCLR